MGISHVVREIWWHKTKTIQHDNSRFKHFILCVDLINVGTLVTEFANVETWIYQLS